MLGVNKVILLGRIGQDPELRYTAAQRAVVSVRLATNRQIYDAASGEKKKFVDWHTVIFNDQLAEFCAQKLSKGSKVFVEGMLEYSQRSHHEFKGVKWTDALVIVSDLQIIDGMLEHEYPNDFPDLPVQTKNKYKKAKSQQNSEPQVTVKLDEKLDKKTDENPNVEDDLFGTIFDSK